MFKKDVKGSKEGIPFSVKREQVSVIKFVLFFAVPTKKFIQFLKAFCNQYRLTRTSKPYLQEVDHLKLIRTVLRFN